MRCFIRWATIVAASVVALTGAAAQSDFPNKPIRLIVGYPPGGNIDATARIVAASLDPILKTSIVVENKPGVGGMLAYDFITGATADGYTMILGATGALAPAIALGMEMRFDPIKGFVSAGPIARAPLMLVVRADLPVKNLAELVAYAKANPGKLTMAVTGTGSVAHLAGELFQTMSGTKFLHVPYKGSSQAIGDLIGGQVDLTFDQPASTLAQIKAGKLRALAIATPERSPLLPELPTFGEAGLPGFEASTTTTLMFRVGTQAEVIAKMNAALMQVLQMPATKERFAALGADVMQGSGADFDRMLQREAEKWTKVVKDSNIKLP